MKYSLASMKLTLFFYLLYVKNIISLKHTKSNLSFLYNGCDNTNSGVISTHRNKTAIQNKNKQSKLKILSLNEKQDDELYYELNPENTEKVLNLIRPKLQIDNGDVELVDIKGNDLYIRLLGNCVTCSSNSVTISQVIKKTLKMYIRGPGNKEPNVIITNFDEINEENILNCLSDLKPYFDFLKIEVVIKELINNKENINNSVMLMFKNIENEDKEVNIPHNIKTEITGRLKQSFPSLTVNFEN
ncbi:hypothetical protein YYE_03349 [Plasmodium vinckei vinckei]|nr:hypothetical protein YYE_03349 [Plasmodium vinckei vinckei]